MGLYICPDCGETRHYFGHRCKAKPKKRKIIHFWDYDGRYLCIKAYGKANPEKATTDKSKVTCNNCLRILHPKKKRNKPRVFVFR